MSSKDNKNDTEQDILPLLILSCNYYLLFTNYIKILTLHEHKEICCIQCDEKIIYYRCLYSTWTIYTVHMGHVKIQINIRKLVVQD